jgi:hypothetical protein
VYKKQQEKNKKTTEKHEKSPDTNDIDRPMYIVEQINQSKTLLR